jgi:putative MATE family efflux protein
MRNFTGGNKMISLKELFSPKDMTRGAPWIRIIEFSIPMLIGNVAQQLYSAVDAAIVGQYVGVDALAAIGGSFPIFMLLLVLFVGVSTGAGIMVSQYFGAKDREKLSKTIGVSITLTAIASLIIMVGGPILVRPLLLLLNTPENIIDMSAQYLIIFCIGIAGFSYYNMLSGILRGLGDSVSALVFLIVSAIINVVLDFVFVVGLNMGVAGAALATIIAQLISAILCTLKLLAMKDVFDLNWKMLKLDRKYSYKLLKIGLPSGATQAIFSLAMILVQNLTNRFGTSVIAATTIIMRVDGFAMMPNFSFGMAMATYAGQNIGAGKLDRVNKGTKQGTLIAVGVSTFLTILILIFGRSLMGIFTRDPELVDLSMRMMKILAFGYIAMAVLQSLSGVMRGAGDTMTPMWISLFTTIVIRVPIAYGIAYLTRSAAYPNGRPESTFISLLLAWTINAFITTIFFKRGKWREKGLVKGSKSIKVDQTVEKADMELEQVIEA